MKKYILKASDFGELNDNDKTWISDNENDLQNEYPIINGIHLSVHSAKEVKEDAYTRFILKYNSALYDGVDIAESFNTEEFGVIKNSLLNSFTEMKDRTGGRK